MNYTSYPYADTYAWRFSQSRSGQPAASVRSITGGDAAHSNHPNTCRTPR